MTIPEQVEINAWCGAPARTPLGDLANRWGSARTNIPHSQRPLDLGEPANVLDWSAPNVGYGVLLPENDEPAAVKAAGADAPDPVRALIEARPGTVVLRWAPELGTRYLRRYYPNGAANDPTIGLSTFGVDPGQLPRYVAIIATPDEIPWTVQYALETRHAVGRIPLSGAALKNYVDALLDDWSGADLDVQAPLMWTVSHSRDITELMRTVVADPLAEKLTDPKLPRFRHVLDDAATAAGLISAIDAHHPALIFTSSHGFAVGADAALRAGLGLPVDVAGETTDLAPLVEAVPPGAIWYSQACCSAGSDATTNYAGLIPEGAVLSTLEAVANLGATVAPAALQLLGRTKPVRAVLGHVEPTFDWTLSVAATGQALGGHIVTALSTNLYNGQPAGYAFDEYRSGVGELHTQWANTHDLLVDGDTSVRDELTRLRVSAIDRQSLVLLGDPTVTLPPLPTR